VKNDHPSSHVVLAKGAAIFLAGRGIGRFTMLAFQVVLARLLTPAAFGLFALSWTSFRLAEAIGPLGLQAGVLRFASATAVADPSSARPTVFRAVRLALASGAILGAAMFIFAPLAATQLFHKAGAIGALRWFALGVPCLTVLIVAAGATQALQTTRYVAAVRELGQPLLIALLAPAAVLAGLGVRGAAAGVVIATTLAAGTAIVLVDRLFPKGTRIQAGVSSRVLLAVSIPAATASTFRLLLSWTDRLVVGAYLPAASLGAYHAAAQLAAVLSMIVIGFSGILAAMIVAALASGNAPQARSLYRTSIKWMLYLATPVLVPLIVAPREVLVAIFGPAYAGAASSLRLLAIGQGLSLLTGAVGSLLVMTGHERRWDQFHNQSRPQSMADPPLGSARRSLQHGDSFGRFDHPRRPVGIQRTGRSVHGSQGHQATDYHRGELVIRVAHTSTPAQLARRTSPDPSRNGGWYARWGPGCVWARS